MAINTAATLTEEVFEQLRTSLLNGAFEPGQRLKLTKLGAEFGVSLSVIREALTRLSEQGLVTANPQRGFSVVALSIADLEDLTRVRSQVETLALRQSLERGDIPWETSVVAAHHTLERTAILGEDGQLNETWPVAHRAFHKALLAGCGSPRLEAIATSLRDSSELYRRWSWSWGGDRHRDLVAEHRLLMTLALERDPDSAVVVLTEHIQRAPRALIAYAREHGLDAPDKAWSAETPV